MICNQNSEYTINIIILHLWHLLSLVHFHQQLCLPEESPFFGFLCQDNCCCWIQDHLVGPRHPCDHQDTVPCGCLCLCVLALLIFDSVVRGMRRMPLQIQRYFHFLHIMWKVIRVRIYSLCIASSFVLRLSQLSAICQLQYFSSGSSTTLN